MKKVQSDPLWNGTISEVYVSDDEIVTRDVMPAKNVQSILDVNHERRADGLNRKANGRLVASIPIPVYHEWKKEWTQANKPVKWDVFLKAKLNDPDNKFLRTTDGRI